MFAAESWEINSILAAVTVAFGEPAEHGHAHREAGQTPAGLSRRQTARRPWQAYIDIAHDRDWVFITLRSDDPVSIRANPMDENIAAQLVARDRLRKKLALLRTPEQRMAEMARLQKAMWATLRSSPDGYRHFLRRNFKARAISKPITDVR
jgi:hypothetical protein